MTRISRVHLPILTITLTGAAFGLSGCTGGAAPALPASPPAPVTVAKAEVRDVPIELGTVGRVEANSAVTVRAQVEGTLRSVNFRQGESVRKGQTLFTIDPRAYQAGLSEAKARVARDNALADNADANVARYVELRSRSQDYVTQDAIDRLRAQAFSLREAARADQAAVDRAEIDLGYCTIRSEIAGRAGDVLVHAGNIVQAGDPRPLAVLLQTKPIQVSFSVPQQNLPEIRRRMAAGRLPVFVDDASGSLSGVPAGVLAFVDNAVNDRTGTIQLKATFANEDEALWPGQFVNVTLRLGVDAGAVVVPAPAVQTGQQGSFVYVVKADGTAESRPVRVTRLRGGEALIGEGIAAGETIITDGQIRVTPGARVDARP